MLHDRKGETSLAAGKEPARWAPIPLAIMAVEWRAGFDADEVDAVAAALQIEAPSGRR